MGCEWNFFFVFADLQEIAYSFFILSVLNLQNIWTFLKHDSNASAFRLK